jgi:hypothetical protein
MKSLRLADPVNDVKVRLDATNPQNRSDGETFAKNPVVQCQFNKIIAANKMITSDEINKCLNVNKSGQKKATDPNPVKQTPCPVGDKKAVMAFQDWLDTNVKGWLPKYPDGLNKDLKKGYGMCGPNTRKAWKSNETTYKVKFVPGEIVHDPKDDDVVVPTNSPEVPKTPETPASETPKQTLTQQKAAPNADIDNEI